LGAAGFYRRFIPYFGEMAAPLTKLLCKEKKFEWSPEAENAYVKLKNAF
jgi:hypothetical protein